MYQMWNWKHSQDNKWKQQGHVSDDTYMKKKKFLICNNQVGAIILTLWKENKEKIWVYLRTLSLQLFALRLCGRTNLFLELK